MPQFESARSFDDRLGELQARLDRAGVACAQLRTLSSDSMGRAVSQSSQISVQRYFVRLRILLSAIAVSALVMLILILL